MKRADVAATREKWRALKRANPSAAAKPPPPPSATAKHESRVLQEALSRRSGNNPRTGLPRQLSSSTRSLGLVEDATNAALDRAVTMRRQSRVAGRKTLETLNSSTPLPDRYRDKPKPVVAVTPVQQPGSISGRAGGVQAAAAVKWAEAPGVRLRKSPQKSKPPEQHTVSSVVPPAALSQRKQQATGTLQARPALASDKVSPHCRALWVRTLAAVFEVPSYTPDGTPVITDGVTLNELWELMVAIHPVDRPPSLVQTDNLLRELVPAQRLYKQEALMLPRSTLTNFCVEFSANEEPIVQGETTGRVSAVAGRLRATRCATQQRLQLSATHWARRELRICLEQLQQCACVGRAKQWRKQQLEDAQRFDERVIQLEETAVVAWERRCLVRTWRTWLSIYATQHRCAVMEAMGALSWRRRLLGWAVSRWCMAEQCALVAEEAWSSGQLQDAVIRTD